MADRFHTIEAQGVRLTLDLDVGHIRSLAIERDGKKIEPFHTAPWVDDPTVAGDAAIPPNLKYLSVDFFCAPFAKSDVEDAPPHGWPANSRWHLLAAARDGAATTAHYELEKRVMGARLRKEITLRDGHPFAYQRHVFEGGRGAVSVASHAMTRFLRAGRLWFSPKAAAELPATQQEGDPSRGRSLFDHPARATDLAKVPLADDATVDLHRYPVGSRHEDFAMLIEAPGSRLGWTAAVRPDSGDIAFSLK